MIREALARKAPGWLSRMYVLMYTKRMGRRYSIAEARANLPSLVDSVESGPPIEITRRGKPVAVVLSPSQYGALTRRGASFAEAYRRFCEEHDLEEVGLEEGFAETSRDRSGGRKVEL